MCANNELFLINVTEDLNGSLVHVRNAVTFESSSFVFRFCLYIVQGLFSRHLAKTHFRVDAEMIGVLKIVSIIGPCAVVQLA